VPRLEAALRQIFTALVLVLVLDLLHLVNVGLGLSVVTTNVTADVTFKHAYLTAPLNLAYDGLIIVK